VAELKTQKNAADVEAFLAGVANDRRREDAAVVAALMAEVTGHPPAMWGKSIVGFGSYHYKYASGREADWMATGFSPRKAKLVLYIMSGFSEYDDLLGKLGKYKTGKSCLYINKLADVDLDVLRELIGKSYAYMKATYPDPD